MILTNVLYDLLKSTLVTVLDANLQTLEILVELSTIVLRKTKKIE